MITHLHYLANQCLNVPCDRWDHYKGPLPQLVGLDVSLAPSLHASHLGSVSSTHQVFFTESIQGKSQQAVGSLADVQ